MKLTDENIRFLLSKYSNKPTYRGALIKIANELNINLSRVCNWFSSKNIPKKFEAYFQEKLNEQ